MLLLRLLAPLLLAARLAHGAPCSGLTVTARASRKKLTSGAPVLLTVALRNTGASTIDGLQVRLTSRTLGGWYNPGKSASVPDILGGSVLWVGQQVAPRKQLKLTIRARGCAGLEAGAATLFQTVVQRVNATGTVCRNDVDPVTVRSPVRSGKDAGRTRRPRAHLAPTTTHTSYRPPQVQVQALKRENPRAPICPPPSSAWPIIKVGGLHDCSAKAGGK